MPPKLEQGGICGGCLGGHRYQLKAVEVLVTWHLWSHVAMDDGAPGTHAHWVMVDCSIGSCCLPSRGTAFLGCVSGAIGV